MGVTVPLLCRSPTDDAGYLGELAARRGFTLEPVALFHGEALPAVPETLPGLVLLGGPGATAAAAETELALLRRAVRAGVPILAHGSGATVVARALGASVVRSAVREIGWVPVHRVDGHATDLWLGELPPTFHLFKWQRQAFGLPQGARPLLGSKWSVNEAFACGSVFAFQGHLELTEALIGRWLEEYPEQVARPSNDVETEERLLVNWGAVVQGADMITLDLPRKVAKLHGVADIVYGNWLERVRERTEGAAAISPAAV